MRRLDSDLRRMSPRGREPMETVTKAVELFAEALEEPERHVGQDDRAKLAVWRAVRDGWKKERGE